MRSPQLPTMADLGAEVREALKRNGAASSATTLWNEIYGRYDEQGPDGVSDLLEVKVKAIRRAAKAEASEMRAAAGAIKKKGRGKKR
jgi:hypothetical protein